MNKQWYIKVLVASFFTFAYCCAGSKNEDHGRRVGGATQVIVPTLYSGSQPELVQKNVDLKKMRRDREEDEDRQSKEKKQRIHEKRQTLKTQSHEQENENHLKRMRIQRIHREDSFKAQVAVADKHSAAAKKADIHIKKLHHVLRDVEHATKKLHHLEKKRIKETPPEKRKEVLLVARRAETEKDQKIADYISCRVHGRCSHSHLKKLTKKRKYFRDALRHQNKVKNNLVSIAEKHYKQAGLKDIYKKERINRREHNIIHGKSHKRTRKHLSETPAQVTRKRHVEVKRQKHEELRNGIKKQVKNHTDQEKKARKAKHKNSNKEIKKRTKKVRIVVQKKSKK